MNDIIEILLSKRGELTANKERAIAEALVKIDADFADREKQIDALLDLAGYVEPVAVVDETPVADEIPAIVEPVADVPAEPVSNVVNATTVY